MAKTPSRGRALFWGVSVLVVAACAAGLVWILGAPDRAAREIEQVDRDVHRRVQDNRNRLDAEFEAMKRAAER